MLYSSAQAWRDAPSKRVLFFGMSGLGKTYISNVLRGSGQWFHYSADYRIGTRYMGEYIADNAKAEAMKVPFLRQLLLNDSIDISSNITFENLSAVTAYLGVPGDPAKGGLPIAEYHRRQDQFRRAEIDALLDTRYFIERSERIYGYPHFICDSGGSICEWVDANDPNDPLLTELSARTLLVWIKGTEAHTQELIRRFDRAPKPMAYQPEFLTRVWQEYLAENQLSDSEVDPHAFLRWTYAQALAHRQPRYEAMAAQWGVTVTADQIAQVQSNSDFEELISSALEARS
ncbi:MULTISPECIES: ATPase [unclassified Epibacterium]|uniref:ATPase n=1 Tax=unclassified Epibacterium TaxID=2639179 RepID=UPI001EF4CB98|nr:MULTISPECIES: ATPase [unclassified Epibacterium]MCG7623271.1 ATPase [Epibacterium sp. Ofav1-8]MCG7626407.1 ATPase [Epibacterium sp. MM17-32]